jgi:DNA-directed RNA polymerase subunit RPC12/RpoP
MITIPVWAVVMYRLSLVRLFFFGWRFGYRGRSSQQLKSDASIYDVPTCSNKRHFHSTQEPRIMRDEDYLLASITENICPDCFKNVLFLAGPEGGCSQNIRCPDCGHTYNWCPGFFAERINNAT